MIPVKKKSGLKFMKTARQFRTKKLTVKRVLPVLRIRALMKSD
jgi:hypothetical protein